MSDDTVSEKIKILQRLYPDYVNSNGTLEYEILLIDLTRANIPLTPNCNCFANTEAYLSSILSVLQESNNYLARIDCNICCANPECCERCTK
jgi:hypothetical protein